MDEAAVGIGGSVGGIGNDGVGCGASLEAFGDAELVSFDAVVRTPYDLMNVIDTTKDEDATTWVFEHRVAIVANGSGGVVEPIASVEPLVGGHIAIDDGGDGVGATDGHHIVEERDEVFVVGLVWVEIFGCGNEFCLFFQHLTLTS